MFLQLFLVVYELIPNKLKKKCRILLISFHTIGRIDGTYN